MSVPKLTFENRKIILKYSCKYKNVAEVRKEYRREFQADSPKRITIRWIKFNFATNGFS